MTDEVAATVHLAFAFDIGDEVDLDRARQILQGERGQLPRRRRTPESIRYRPAPIRLELEPEGIACREIRPRPPPRRADSVRFCRDLISVRFHLKISPQRLLELAGRLAEPAALTEAARRLLCPLARADQARGLRLCGQRLERRVHRLSTLGEPARLARSPGRLDRRAGEARIRALEPRRDP